METNVLDRKITLWSVTKFALPSVIMMVFMSLYTIIDGIFVSKFVGTAAFSSINIVYPLCSLMIGLGAMFGAGGTAIIARKLGEGRKKEACANLSLIVIAAGTVGAVMTAISLIFMEPILYFLGANQEIYVYCFDYLNTLAYFFIPNILQTMLLNVYSADGKPQVGLAVTIASGVLNVLLDYVFMGPCRMGITGAALATGIGYTVSTGFGLIWFAFHRSGNLRFGVPKFDGRAILKTLSNGSSEMITNLSTCVTTLLFNLVLMKAVGPDGVAAMTIVMYFDFMLIAVALGYSMGVAPLFSYQYGAGNVFKTRRLFRVSIRFCVGVGFAVALIAFLLAEPLSSFFVERGSEVYDMAVLAIRIGSVGYLVKSFNVFASSMFTAFGNGVISAVLSVSRTLVFLVSALFALRALFGLTGVWCAPPVAEILALVLSVVMTLCFRKRYFMPRPHEPEQNCDSAENSIAQ